MNMACTLFDMTPEEALAGTTVHAARALGLSDRGTIEVGKRTDLALWNVKHPAHLSWEIAGLFANGKYVAESYPSVAPRSA
jgi:imidazolonepropionase